MGWGLRSGGAVLLAGALAPGGQACAQAVEPPVVASQQPSCTACIPRLTIVELVIDADLGSKLSTTGATFPLHLDKPVIVDGHEVVPAGTSGQGEVIHAKKAGGSGAAGELVLAARFLTFAGRQIRLRSMRIAVAGKDATGTVDAFNAASAGAAVFAPVPLGLLGFAISGKNVVVPAGTHALAKTAEDFALETQPVSPPVPPPSAPVASTDQP